MNCSATGTANAAPPTEFTNTFVISSSSDSKLVLSEVPKAVDPSRQRRAHQKSRTGCENCRRRRVKVCSVGFVALELL